MWGGDQHRGWKAHPGVVGDKACALPGGLPTLAAQGWPQNGGLVGQGDHDCIFLLCISILNVTFITLRLTKGRKKLAKQKLVDPSL